MTEKQAEAINLFKSIKGRILIGKALAYSVKYLEEVHKGTKEHIDIIDMKLLGEELFPPFFQMYYTGIKFK